MIKNKTLTILKYQKVPRKIGKIDLSDSIRYKYELNDIVNFNSSLLTKKIDSQKAVLTSEIKKEIETKWVRVES